MKTIYLLAGTILFAAFGCNRKTDNVYPTHSTQSMRQKILRVEGGLMPATIIVGEPGKTSTLSDRMKYFNVPGVSIAVIKDHKVEWAKSYGVKEAGTTDSIELNTLFQAASMSKPITAMIALKLEEENIIDLKQDINLHFLRRDALLSGGHQVLGNEPISEGKMRRVQDRPASQDSPDSAIFTLKLFNRFHPVMSGAFAISTRNALFLTLFPKIVSAGLLIGKLFEKIYRLHNHYFDSKLLRSNVTNLRFGT